MPIQYRKTPTTLQEKIDKAIEITYKIHNADDAGYMRSFIIELIEQAFKKIRQVRHGEDLALYPLTPDECEIQSKIDELKRNNND